ncbi:MAG TPA: glycoside hydrolase family protein, partial [Candidatus Alistipes merdipullorum]|nr:glycoside hydrolase family protein [Candidatus Alistipes merdipullorum]
VKGGRFMDRILPMPDGRKAKHTWGTAEVAQRFVDNGIEMPDTSFWGGNILKGDDGLYHMYVCGWPEDSPQGHMFWPNSTVYHAVAKRLHGPYTIRETIGKGHNPEAYRLDDGRIVIYVIGGYYIADSFNGPWQYSQFEFDQRDRPVIEGLSNLTFARRDDGSRLMVCRGGGVWISRDGLKPYRQITEKRIYPPVDGEFEDPVVWRDSLQYHLIVNDWLGRIAYYQRSIDGVHWVTEQGEAYVPGVSVHKDGYIEQWFKYERPKIFQDSKGRVEQINFAVIDTIKWNDLPNDRHSSKNICLPMNKGLLIEVLNREPIDQHTKTIELLIKGEKGFKPARDLDIGSLRLGSYTEVNFGGGAKATGMRKQGNDIVVTFDARDSGIDPTEFAPKLLGCNRKGEIIFGYASLPYVDYRPAILSSLRPTFNAEGGCIITDMENFGLSASKESTLTITTADGRHFTASIPPIEPYGKATVRIDTDTTVDLQGCEVTVTTAGKVVHSQQW